MIFFDTETDPFAPGRQFPPVVCGQFARGGDSAVLVSAPEVVPTVRALIDAGHSFCGHTIAFDFGVVCAEDPAMLPVVFDLYEQGRVFDVAVTQKLLDISTGERKRRAYDLSSISRRYGFGALDKGEEGFRTKFGDLRHVPIDAWPERARKYALDDVLVCARIRAAQLACNFAGVLEDEQRQAAYAWWLKLASAWGINTDKAGVDRFEIEIRAEHLKAGDKLRAIGWLEHDRPFKSGARKGQIKVGSRKTAPVIAAVRRATADMSDEEKDRRGYLTATGAPSTNKKVLRELADAMAESDNAIDRATAEAFYAYADFSSLGKTISTDIPLLRLGCGQPIHTFFDSLKETGRIGSSKPNITNLPTKEGVRECFVPRPGWCFVSAD